MRGLEAARRLGPAATIDEVTAAGIRGRGGAGFPTGTKWTTVARNASPVLPSTVVVNGAEGEPGSFKDRAILRTNPYRVVEGALIAAHAVGADRVIVALKRTFDQEVERVQDAIAAFARAELTAGIELSVFRGPTEYLFGEETGLLEALEGRPPFPRVAPPYRHGADELGDGSESAAHVELAAPGAQTSAPPTLANNVETLAHVTLALTNGPTWFREVGTDQSPGTVVCTVSGSTRRHGVAEVPMGTPLSELLERVGGGPKEGRAFVAAISGVANAFVPAARFATPLTYEDMTGIGSGLGAAGFIVIDDADDVVAFAQGVSRFLAIESCGQCTPCKADGLALADHLDRLRRADGDELDVVAIGRLAETVADEARCSLALQHQIVVRSLLALFSGEVADRVALGPGRRCLVAPIADLVDGQAVLDQDHADKQPDWGRGTDSGAWPAQRLDERDELARGVSTGPSAGKSTPES